jgi:hypothetical protein
MKYLTTDKHENMIVNFSLFPAIESNVSTEDLHFFNTMDYARSSNPKHCKALVKAMKVINDLLANKECAQPKILHDIVHKLDKRSLLITTMFTAMFFRQNDDVYYVMKNIEDYHLHYDWS